MRRLLPALLGFLVAFVGLSGPSNASASETGRVRLLDDGAKPLVLGAARPGGDTVRLLDHDLGGGDGILTGTARAAAFLVIGVGVGVALVGAAFVEGSQIPTGANPTIGWTLVGGGALGLLAGVLVLSGVNCIACSTCGLAENDGKVRDGTAPREALAGFDGGRRVPGALTVAGWGATF